MLRIARLAGLTLVMACSGGPEKVPCNRGNCFPDRDASAAPDAGLDSGPDAGDDGSGEICNGLDDDGDGHIDEGDPGAGLVCQTGLALRCGQGRTSCVDGHLECTPDVTPAPEACDNAGVDDDCNGVDDDIVGLGGSCETGLSGACAAGTLFCDGTELACALDTSPVAEICVNSVDDDCDGDTDEADCVGGEG